MVEYKITPADHIKIEGISPTDNWRDLTVSFRNKVLPAGNLDKPIGNKCYKLLKSLIKKDKVSSSTLSKGCPSLNKKNMKDQTKSITKMEIKKDRDIKKKEQGDSKSNANNRKEDYYSALLNNIVKKQNEAQKQIISGQVETVNKVLVDTTQKNTGILYNETLEQQYVYAGLKRPTKEQIFNPDKKMKQEAREGRARYKAFQEGKLKEFDQFIIDTRGGARAGENVAMEKFLKDNPPKNLEYDNEEEAHLGKIPAHDEYFPWSDTNSVSSKTDTVSSKTTTVSSDIRPPLHTLFQNDPRNNNDNYEEFVIPQYSVELDPILNDPRNN